MTRELLQKAIEQLEDWLDFGGTHMPFKTHDDDIWTNTENTITAIREYLAQPDQEPICPMCAAKIDEAAGVDLAGLKQQLADVTKERDLAFGEIEASARRIDDLENSADIRHRELYRAQHYAQQLREALKRCVVAGFGTDCEIYAKMALELPNDTSVLDALVKDAERYRWLRDNDACVLECVVEKRGFRSTAPNATRETWLEHQGWTVSTLPITGMAYQTMDAAIDAARGK